jgi:hypothetical protein
MRRRSTTTQVDEEWNDGNGDEDWLDCHGMSGTLIYMPEADKRTGRETTKRTVTAIGKVDWGEGGRNSRDPQLMAGHFHQISLPRSVDPAYAAFY